MGVLTITHDVRSFGVKEVRCIHATKEQKIVKCNILDISFLYKLPKVAFSLNVILSFKKRKKNSYYFYFVKSECFDLECSIRFKFQDLLFNKKNSFEDERYKKPEVFYPSRLHNIISWNIIPFSVQILIREKYLFYRKLCYMYCNWACLCINMIYYNLSKNNVWKQIWYIIIIIKKQGWSKLSSLRKPCFFISCQKGFITSFTIFILLKTENLKCW